MELKRTLSLLLCLALVLGLFSGCGSRTNPTAEPDDSSEQLSAQERGEPRPDDEYERAGWYGFLPEDLVDADPDNTVLTWEQYCAMLGSAIRLHNENDYPEWQKMTKQAPDKEMKRDGAMVSLLFAAKTMGYASFNAEAPAAFDSYSPKVWEVVTMDYPVFDWNTPIDLGNGCSDNNHVGPAYDFCLRRVSLESEKSLLEFDDAGDLRLNQSLTLREAALSVIRLYESGKIPVQLSEETKLEFQKAVSLELVSQAYAEEYSETVRYDEFCAMLTKVIQLRYGEGQYLDAWLENAAAALTNTEEMSRGGGAEAIFAAALSVGMDDYHSGAYLQHDIDSGKWGDTLVGAPYRTDLFPILEKPYYNKNWGIPYDDGFRGAQMYVWHRASPVSQKILMEYDSESNSMRYEEPFTRMEAICAVLRCYEAWTPREYVPTNDPVANTYDSSILVAELLNKKSNLPEVTHEKLPSEWQGLCVYYPKATTQCSIIDSFTERDIRFLSENNMNFARVLLSFTSLRYPDYPEDGNQVNLAELRDLDQMIAWALEYDIHVSLGMISAPGYAEEGDIANQSIDDSRWPDAKRWDLIEDYWVMLASRYADIPTKNLTFELCTEWGAFEETSISDFAANWSRIVGRIREISPDRVLIAGFDTAHESRLVLAEEMAALGVSVAAHPYYPGEMHYHSRQRRLELGYTQELQWPMVWFPTDSFNNGDAPLHIRGAISDTELTVYIGDEQLWATDTGDSAIHVATSDGTVLGSHKFTSGGAGDAMRVSIPAGVEEIVLTSNGHLELYCLSIEGSFGTSQIVATDAYGSISRGEASLVVGNDGTWSDVEGQMYDVEAFYQYGLVPYLELAEKYGIGFMVNEYIVAQQEQDQLEPISMDAYLENMTDCIDLFESNGIGYALTFCAHNNIGVIGDAREKSSGWSGYPDYLGTLTYTYDNGFSETFPVNNILLNRIQEHMK